MRQKKYKPFGAIVPNIYKKKDGTEKINGYIGRVSENGKQISVVAKSVLDVKIKLLSEHREAFLKKMMIREYSHFEDFLALYAAFYILKNNWDEEKAYLTALRKAYRYFGNIELRKIEILNCCGFVQSMAHLSNNTQIAYFMTLSKFFSRAVELNLMDENPLLYVEGPKRVYKEPLHFEEKNVKEVLLSALDDRFFDEMFLSSLIGGRIAEILSIDYRDILFERRQIYLHQQFEGSKKKIHLKKHLKENKTRYVDFPSSAIPYLEKLIEKAKQGDNPYHLLFPDHDGLPILKSVVDTHVRKIADSLGLKGFTFHKFRAYFLSKLMELCNDIEFVRKSAGHAYATTTLIYLQTFSNPNPNITLLEKKENKIQIEVLKARNEYLRKMEDKYQ